jgi:predicted nucleic acid-binding protein
VTLAIADTDILSTFGKLGRVDLLRELFPKIYVPPAVYRELGTAERLGFPWAGTVREAVELLFLIKDDVEEVEHLAVSYPQLGSGEIETLVLANTHHLLCLTSAFFAISAVKLFILFLQFISATSAISAVKIFILFLHRRRR